MKKKMGAENEREKRKRESGRERDRRRGKNILDAERCFSGALSLGDEQERNKMRERERKSTIRKGNDIILVKVVTIQMAIIEKMATLG